MNKLSSRLTGACSALLVASVLPTSAVATGTTNITIYSYAAKFLCEE